jgi:predicted transcriptional regulator
MQMPANSVPLSIKLDAALRARLTQLADSRKCSSHALAKEAIELYVQSAEAKDSANQEALAAYAHFQKTGLHANGDEVTAWLQAWGTEDEKPAPECHV